MNNFVTSLLRFSFQLIIFLVEVIYYCINSNSYTYDITSNAVATLIVIEEIQLSQERKHKPRIEYIGITKYLSRYLPKRKKMVLNEKRLTV